jgi:hypothetical protein
MDKTVPRLQKSQKNDGGDFLIILNSLMSSGKTQLKKKLAQLRMAKRYYRWWQNHLG